ncbi:MAG: hypothetical protein Q9170_004724 [Blastenia crenularia]
MPSTITPEQWDQHKDEFFKLYFDEGLTLKPVMRAMRTPDFNPTQLGSSKSESFLPMEPYCQIPSQWHEEFSDVHARHGTTSMDQQFFAEDLPGSSFGWTMPSDHADALCTDVQEDAEEFKERAKKEIMDLKSGSPGQSRIRGLQRVRRRSSSQQQNSINMCRGVSQAGTRDPSHMSRILPAAVPSVYTSNIGTVVEVEDWNLLDT